MRLSRRNLLAGIAGSGLLSVADVLAANRRWTDVHMHVVSGPDRQLGTAVDRAVARMDALGIAKAVVFPPPMPAPLFDYPDYLAHLQRYPGRFGFLGGGGYLNSLLHRFAQVDSVTKDVEQRFIGIARRMVNEGAVGFGEIALLHLSLTPGHAFEQARPEHPLMLALVEIAGRRDVVIDLHMDAVPGDSVMQTPAPLRKRANPAALIGNIVGFERLLAHERNARIVWAHGGSDMTGHMTPALIRRLMDAHPNLYMSLRPVPAGVQSSMLTGLRFHNTLLTEAGISAQWLDLLKTHANRFVMGADAFFLAPTAPSEMGAATLSRGNEARLTGAAQLMARLPPDLAQKIGHENAARLYRV
jgi:hypothetical protein